MRGLFHRFSLAFPIVWIGLIVLSTHSLWTQSTSSPEETTVELPDAPTPVATVSDPQVNFRLAYRSFPLICGQKQDRTESWIQFSPHQPSYDRLPELGREGGHSTGRAPSKWMTFVPVDVQGHLTTNPNAKDLEYYSHHLGGAGAIIRGISRQAKAHPHVTNVLKLFHPRF
jgi:hypothetical protein